MAHTSLVTWGNGQGIRIPKHIMDEADLHIGDQLNIAVRNGSITLTHVHDAITIPDFAAMFENYHGPQPSEDDWKPVGREA